MSDIETDAQLAQDKSDHGLPIPNTFTREALPKPRIGGKSAAERQQSAEPMSSPQQGDTEARERFAEATHQYIREYIQFADKKATFLFTAATALLAFLYKTIYPLNG